MQPGRKPYPLVRVSPQLRERYNEAISIGLGAATIAAVAGFPQTAALSTQMHAARVAASPLVVERFERVAEILGVPADQIFVTVEEARS